MTTRDQSLLKLKEYERELAEKEKVLKDKDIEINELKSIIAIKDEIIKELEEKNKELNRRLNMNSQNSSKPPSTDGYNKPTPKSLREQTGKKPGGQKGHAGANIKLPHSPDVEEKHHPKKCISCLMFYKCNESGKVFRCKEKRYEIKTIIGTEVIEHQRIGVDSCPQTHETLKGEFPNNIRGYIQYDDLITAFVGLLSTHGSVSINRIHQILGAIFGIQLSTGTVASMVKRCAGKVHKIVEEIKELVKNSKIVHFDETGTSIKGLKSWVHNASTQNLTYQIVSSKRGYTGMLEMGIINDFHGIGVHDCWQSYWKNCEMKHAVCNVHILRELNGVEENNKKHEWPSLLRNLFLEMKNYREIAINLGKNNADISSLLEFENKYDYIMELAHVECPDPPQNNEKKRGKKKKGKERALIERLMALKDSIFLFLRDFNVPFSNNLAEQDIRNVKTKKKISGCFRTTEGHQDYLDIISFLSTGRKNGIDPFTALMSAFEDSADIVLPK